MKKIERRRRRERESNCLEKKKNKKRDQIIIIMLQKAKTIKKTIKTEVKAIVHGQERVDKRGKPVTSIADRTNVRAAHKTLFFYYSHFIVSSGFVFEKRKKSIFVMAEMPSFVCVLLPREEDTKHTKKFFRVFSSTPAASRKTTEKRRDTFYDDDHHHHHHHHHRPDAACFLFFPFIYRRSFRNLSRRKSTRNWKTRA